MKVVAINGSSRKDGNTAIMLQTVLDELAEAGIDTEMVQLAGKPVSPCKACWGCGGKGTCINEQDAFCSVFAKIKAADGILLGSPAYSANVSSIMQAFLERAAVVCDSNPGLLTHKIGSAVAAARRGGALQTVDTMNRFFLNHEMFVVGSTYWNLGYGQLPGDIQKDVEGIRTMKNLGKNLAWLLKTVEGRP